MWTIFFLLLLAWVVVGGQFVLQRRREGKADNSVASFRQQLSTLERATPGSIMRHSLTGPVPMVKVDGAPSKGGPIDVKQRRKQVLMGLGGATAVTFLLRLVVPGLFTTFLFLLSLGLLGTYVWALRQIHLRAVERHSLTSVPAVNHSNVTSIVGRTSAVDHAEASERDDHVVGTTYFPGSFAAN